MRAGAGVGVGAVVVAGLVAACGGSDAGAGDADTRTAEAPAATADMAETPAQDGTWIPLFDGTDLSAWRGYRRADLPAAWQARDGLLTFVPGEEGGDIVTREQYDDFELVLDWRVGPAGNSGLFYRATEDFEVIWHGAPELQILDDAGHGDGEDPITSAGAAYALYPPTEKVVRPAGEWNEVRVVASGPHVEHWLNGVKVVEYEAGSEDWNERVAGSKFAEYPGFGEARRGHIGLQDHGDTVWFRNIRIRPIRGVDR